MPANANPLSVLPSGRQAREAGLEIALALQTHNLFGDLSLIEQQQSWNGPNTILCRQGLLFVYVYFPDLDAPVKFLRQLIEDGSDHLARTTPFRPKIDEDRR